MGGIEKSSSQVTTTWSRSRLLAVRFAAIFVALNVASLAWLLPFGLKASEAFRSMIRGPVSWFGETFLRLDVVRHDGLGGSGDTAFDWSWLALCALIAAISAVGWTLAKPQRQSEATLQTWLYTGLRYGLAIAMLQYGIIKVLPSQFPAPQGDVLLATFGDSSPMGLLWRYMGFSTAFNVLAGSVEMLGGFLLLSRRTWLAGALVSALAMTQVVTLNFAFDVPVKIFSSQLLVAALVLLIPFRHRLFGALLTDRALPPRSPMPRIASAWAGTSRPLAKAAVLVLILGFMTDGAWRSFNEFGHGASFELAGIYDVEPASTTEIWAPVTVISIDNGRRLSLWREPGDRSTWRGYSVELDDDVLRLTSFDGRSAGDLEITRVNDNQLELSGVIDGNAVTVTLVERPEPELTRRGFHWVSEFPYNR